ncbi:MAG TPA: hypothetical protein PKY30_21690 [Myxococcota bacterium]|nr:hypothetical protein [Myxococcota bacterium]
MLLLLLVACNDPCATDGIDYADPSCYEEGSTGKPLPQATEDACTGVGYTHGGPLRQFCVECGSILCVYRVRSDDAIGGAEVEIKAPLPEDPDWVEYHDAFVEVEGKVDGTSRTELALTVTDDADAYVSNETTLFNFSDAALFAELTVQVSLMAADGTYPECLVSGAHPELFEDGCTEVDWKE